MSEPKFNLTDEEELEHAQSFAVKMIEENDALQARIKELEAQQGWKDIKDAPRDGSIVLLWAPGWAAPSTGWTHENDPWQECPWNPNDRSFLPTHWQPLPTPPTKEGDKE